MLNYNVFKFHVPESYSLNVVKPCHDRNIPRQYTDKQVWRIYTWLKQSEIQHSSISSYESTFCQKLSLQVFSFLCYKSLEIVDLKKKSRFQTHRQTDRWTDSQKDTFFSSLTIISKTHVNILIHRHIDSETQRDRQRDR